MRFDGEIWFDFTTPSVWVFYQWVRALAETGTDVSLDWMPTPVLSEQVAMATLLAVEKPQDRGRFLHAMLDRVHVNGRSASDTQTVIEALQEAGIDTSVLVGDHELLSELRERVTELEIDSVPTLYRHGPVLSIQLNLAVLHGDVVKVARIINEVIETDGVWELRKP